MKEKSNYNSPFGISWNALRKELFTPEEIAESDARIRALEGLQQIQEGKTKNFNEVCERLENKYANEYSCAVKPPVRQTGNRLSGPTETANACLLAQ